jgi:hypothetical protein
MSGDIPYWHHFAQIDCVTLECPTITALFIRKDGFDLAQLLARRTPDASNINFSKVPMRPGWQEHDPARYRTSWTDIFAPTYRTAYQARLWVDLVYDRPSLIECSLIRVVADPLAVIKYAYGHGFPFGRCFGEYSPEMVIMSLLFWQLLQRLF